MYIRKESGIMSITPVRPVGHAVKNTTKTLAQQAHQKWVKYFNSNVAKLQASEDFDEYVCSSKSVASYVQNQESSFINEIDQRLLDDARRRGDWKEVEAIERELVQ